MSEVPDYLHDEQRAVEQQIRAAFRSVTSRGEISWTESRVMDLNGSDWERLAARARDSESCWEELVDDPEWNDGMGVGGFAFLDPMSKTYYLAPALIRWTRGTGSAELHQWLNMTYYQSPRKPRDPENYYHLNESQCRAVARFLRFMMALESATGDYFNVGWWHEAYRSYWHDFDTEHDRL